MLMLDVRNAIARMLDRATLAQVVEITLRKMRRDKIDVPFARHSFGSKNFSSHESPELEWLALVREKVESLRYGVVQIVIHDSKVTLIERTEKTRLNSNFQPTRHLEETNLTRAHTGLPDGAPPEMLLDESKSPPLVWASAAPTAICSRDTRR